MHQRNRASRLPGQAETRHGHGGAEGGMRSRHRWEGAGAGQAIAWACGDGDRQWMDAMD